MNPDETAQIVAPGSEEVPGADANQNPNPGPSKEDAARIEDSAKEAGLMMLDHLMGEEGKPEDKKGKPEEQKAADDTEKGAANTPHAKPAKEQSPPAVKSDEDDQQQARKPQRRVIKASELEEMTRAAAEDGARRALEQSEAARQKLAPTNEPPKVEVPEDLAEEADRLAMVQKIFPNAYKGRDLVRELVENDAKTREYTRKWQKKNPGQQIDWADPEHADFLDGASVDVDSTHLTKAEQAIMRDQAVKEAEKRINELYGDDISEVRRMREEAAIAPIRQKVDREASEALLSAIRPDLDEAYRRDPASVIEEIKKDPVAVEVVSKVERWSVPALDAAVRYTNNPDRFKDNPEVMNLLVQSALKAESVLGAAAPENRPVLEDGRQFATMADFAAMPPSKQARHYTVRDEHLLIPIITNAARLEAAALKEAEENRFMEFAKRRGLVEKGSSDSQRQEQAPPPQKPAPTVRSSPQKPADSKKQEQSTGGVPDAFWAAVGMPPP